MEKVKDEIKKDIGVIQHEVKKDIGVIRDEVKKEVEVIRDDVKKEIDFYRDTPARLLGYANEVGESFRALVHVNFVRFTYVVSCAYVVADTADKSNKCAKKWAWATPEERRNKVAITAVDTLLWQGFASVIVPGFTINRLCFFTRKLLEKTTKLPSPARKWTATFVGLAAIPFIVKPIDAAVELGMDNSFRKLYDVHGAHS
uniref:Mitochondrial fission process protein 1 n=1 Tax=Plectus sambesii TaxID=2011161 RepID=A0A914W5A5_9BILA